MKTVFNTLCCLFALCASACSPPAEPAHDVELAPMMLLFQTHAEKLHWSGEAENWALVDFYLHELEETTEGIAGAGITEEGFAVSANIEGLMGPPIEAMEKASKAKDKAGFATAYGTLVQACNGCHTSSKHGFIVIQTPTKPQFTNQRFEPVPAP